MFVAEGKGGFRVYDVAAVGNKGFSERIIRAPFSPLGHDTHVKSANATCMAIGTNQPISMARNDNIRKNFPENHEQALHPLYRYAVITDSVEGLILVDIDTLADGEFRNNRLTRALTKSEEHTSELQSLMRNSYADFSLKKKHIRSNPTAKQSSK